MSFLVHPLICISVTDVHGRPVGVSGNDSFSLLADSYCDLRYPLYVDIIIYEPIQQRQRILDERFVHFGDVLSGLLCAADVS